MELKDKSYLLDCEKECPAWERMWHDGGHCPLSFNNNDGGFWCNVKCGRIERSDNE